MAFSAVFGGFAFNDVVCVNGPVQSTPRSKWYLCLGLDLGTRPAETITILVNQLAGNRGSRSRSFLCDWLFFQHRLKRIMTIDDASTRSRLDTLNFRPN